jgi:hypothetical protein
LEEETMLIVTLFGHIEVPEIRDRPVRRRGDTRIDRRPTVPERYRP